MDSYLTQKSQSDLGSSHEKLEYLASHRKNLKAAIQESESAATIYMSTGSSFLCFGRGEASGLLKEKLTKVEAELTTLCREIQKMMEEQEKAGKKS